MTPTQRTLKYLRDQGYTCAVVEKWNPHAKIRQDLFGFIDIIALPNIVDHDPNTRNDTIGVQATSGDNVSARVNKIRPMESAYWWLASPFRRVWVIGWSKRGPRGKRKVWCPRVVEITAGDLHGSAKMG